MPDSLDETNAQEATPETMLEAVSELLVLVTAGEYALAWNLCVLIETWLRGKIFGKVN